MLVVTTLVGPAAHAQPDEEAAAAAAREIAAAQDRANKAAEEYLLAESQLEVLEDQAAQLAAEQSELQATVDALRAQVEQAAVQRFMSSGSGGIPILTGYQQPLDQLRAEVLSNVAGATSADMFDQYDVAKGALDDKAAALDDTREQVEDQRQHFDELSKTMVQEVERLKAAEAKRLEDERVRLALEAQRREEQRRAEEQRRQLEAQQAAERQRAAEEQQRAQQAMAAFAAANPPAAPSAAAGDGGLPAAPAPDGATTDESAPAGAGSDLVCPVAGTRAYADTYGAPRSGGRRHQGVDLISPGGTPLVAVTSGSVQFKQNSLGGNAVWLTGDNGTKYYYAHLSAYEGSSRQVSQGEVIGYVGATGNTTVNHLHFEVHPGGGAAVNPTPYVRNAGC